MKDLPSDLKQEAAEEDTVVLISTPYWAVEDPVTQHCKSLGPTQYPETDFPPFDEHNDVCMHVPDPEGVEHLACVQHLISEDPGQRLEVVVPEQHPAEILTQTPSYPLTVQVA